MEAVAIGNSKRVNKKEQGETPKKISWEQFQKEYLSREDGFKYEWLNGIIEKSPRTMDYKQLQIVENILAFFERLKTVKNIKGRMHEELDTFFVKKHRRPDLCFITSEQLKKIKEEPPVPSFVVEIISISDNVNRINRKVDDYFNADVKVIWHVFPELKKVHVYENSKRILICEGTDLCSAETAIEGFVLSVNDIFENV